MSGTLYLSDPRPLRGANMGWNKENKEDRMAIGMAQKIIIEGVSSQIAFNIMDIDNPKDMWDTLKRICSEVGQGAVYSVLQEILNYPRIHKPKGYDKPVVEIFAEVRFLCKRLKAAITAGRDPFDTIAIVIIPDTLHSDFEATTASMLETGDKAIEELQSIIQSKEAKYKAKRSTGQLEDAEMDQRWPMRSTNCR